MHVHVNEFNWKVKRSEFACASAISVAFIVLVSFNL